MAKQDRVRLYLNENNIKYLSYDKRLDDGICGNERPDFLFESKSKGHFVVLEVDEHQHYGRPEQCECIRMVNISQSIGAPTIFIRYNPDSFKINGKKENPSHKKRMKVLKEVLENAMGFE